MRGKQTALHEITHADRITPAHAGKTSNDIAINQHFSDHPRACGENIRFSVASFNGCGSPPRMRGKPEKLAGTTISCRITPAHAGKTKPAASGVAGVSDHPRACGENAHTKGVHMKNLGSPPRMRGKLRLYGSRPAPRRITPAHAGKTRQPRRARR